MDGGRGRRGPRIALGPRGLVTVQSPRPGKVLVGVYGPSRTSAACRALLPPGAGCSRLSWAPVVCCGHLLSEASARCLSRAAVACRGPAAAAAAAAAAAVGGPAREIMETNVPVVPLNKKFEARVLQRNGRGDCPGSNPSTASRGDRSQHKAYPLGTYTKQIWKRQNRTFTIRFAQHNALFKHERNHITSLSAWVLANLVAGWRKIFCASPKKRHFALFQISGIITRPIGTAFRHGVASAL